MKYYLLKDQIDYPGRWYLGAILHVNNWNFLDPPVEFMEPCRYATSVYRDGVATDFTLNEAFGVPVVSSKFFAALKDLEEVKEDYYHVVFQPTDIEGSSVAEDFYIMVVETQYDCVDENRSQFEKFSENDPVRPDKAGEYSVFLELVIDPSRVGDKHIFRLKHHLHSLIVSETVKSLLESAGVSGVCFECVVK